MAFALFSFTTAADRLRAGDRRGHRGARPRRPLLGQRSLAAAAEGRHPRQGRPLLRAGPGSCSRCSRRPSSPPATSSTSTVGHFERLPERLHLPLVLQPVRRGARPRVALFALVFQTRRSLRWASAIAALFTVASIAWPYSKIGMETTFMSAILAAFALAVWARRSPSLLSWGLTGFATGAAVATKAYALVSVAADRDPALAGLPGARAAPEAAAGASPSACRCCSGSARSAGTTGRGSARATDFGYPDSPLTMSAPLNFLGLLFSPGKGLIFYSPLVVLGALGLPRMWREDRSLTLALLAFFVTPHRALGRLDLLGRRGLGARATSSRPPGRCSCRSPGGRARSPARRSSPASPRSAILVQVDRRLGAVRPLHRRRPRADRGADLPRPARRRPARRSPTATTRPAGSPSSRRCSSRPRG